MAYKSAGFWRGREAIRAAIVIVRAGCELLRGRM